MRALRGKEINETRLKNLDDYFYRLLKPKIFAGSKGVEAEFDRAYETTCVIMSQNVGRDPKAMLTIEYLQTLEVLKNQNRKRERAEEKRLERTGKR